jgi:hypothetical protein
MHNVGSLFSSFTLEILISLEIFHPAIIYLYYRFFVNLALFVEIIPVYFLPSTSHSTVNSVTNPRDDFLTLLSTRFHVEEPTRRW